MNGSHQMGLKFPEIKATETIFDWYVNIDNE